MGNVHQHIPNRLRKHRKLMGYTQKDVALLLGFTTTERISKWEHGMTMPGTINLIKLSLLYHVFPTDLYYGLMDVLRHELEERRQSLCVTDSNT